MKCWERENLYKCKDTGEIQLNKCKIFSKGHCCQHSLSHFLGIPSYSSLLHFLLVSRVTLLPSYIDDIVVLESDCCHTGASYYVLRVTYYVKLKSSWRSTKNQINQIQNYITFPHVTKTSKKTNFIWTKLFFFSTGQNHIFPAQMISMKRLTENHDFLPTQARPGICGFRSLGADVRLRPCPDLTYDCDSGLWRYLLYLPLFSSRRGALIWDCPGKGYPQITPKAPSGGPFWGCMPSGGI